MVVALCPKQTPLLPFPAIKRPGKLGLLSGENSPPGESQSRLGLAVLLVKLGQITLGKGFGRAIFDLGRQLQCLFKGIVGTKQKSFGRAIT